MRGHDRSSLANLFDLRSRTADVTEESFHTDGAMTGPNGAQNIEFDDLLTRTLPLPRQRITRLRIT